MRLTSSASSSFARRAERGTRPSCGGGGGGGVCLTWIRVDDVAARISSDGLLVAASIACELLSEGGAGGPWTCEYTWRACSSSEERSLGRLEEKPVLPHGRDAQERIP